jgi:peptidoglycan/LPS O-acetylase OafA/YrhL
MERLSRLDGLRGVLAVYVMLGHAMPFTMLPGWITGPLHHGEAAVDLFFALSGLVIVNSLEHVRFRFWPFLRARARRLLPVYYAVLALAVFLIFLGSPLASMPWVTPASAAGQFWALGLPHLFAWQLLAHLTLTHGLIPYGALPWAYITLLGPAWSLSTEWQFYIAMALVLARMQSPNRLTVFAYALLVVGACYHAVAPYLPGWWQFSRAFLPDAAPYFVLGLASLVWLRTQNPIPFLIALAVSTLLGLVSDVPSKALIPLGWAAALLAQRNSAFPVLPKLLDSRLAQYLGAISYPLYLLNEPVQRACAMLIAPLTHGDPMQFTEVWLPVAVTMPILAAMALHHAVEKPFLRRGSAARPALL